MVVGDQPVERGFRTGLQFRDEFGFVPAPRKGAGPIRHGRPFRLACECRAILTQNRTANGLGNRLGIADYLTASMPDVRSSGLDTGRGGTVSATAVILSPCAWYRNGPVDMELTFEELGEMLEAALLVDKLFPLPAFFVSADSKGLDGLPIRQPADGSGSSNAWRSVCSVVFVPGGMTLLGGCTGAPRIGPKCRMTGVAEKAISQQRKMIVPIGTIR